MLVKGVRCVIENPYSTAHYLVRYCPLKSDYVIMDRSKYGDYFKKPTQFWFINCEPRNGLVAVDWNNKPTKIVDRVGRSETLPRHSTMMSSMLGASINRM